VDNPLGNGKRLMLLRGPEAKSRAPILRMMRKRNLPMETPGVERE
jgi:hypothetical protein